MIPTVAYTAVLIAYIALGGQVTGELPADDGQAATRLNRAYPHTANPNPSTLALSVKSWGRWRAD